MKHRLSVKTIETFLLGFIAFGLSGAIVRLISSGTGTEDLTTQGDPRFEVALAAFYLIAGLIYLAHLAPSIRATLSAPAIPALLVLACISPLWAELPGVVARRAVGVVGATLFGIVLASRLSFDDQLLLFRRLFRICAALCVVAFVAGKILGVQIVTGSTGGIMDSGGAGPWRGIFNHKNMLGSAVAIGILAEWHLPARSTFSRTLKVGWMCLYAALLILSDSMTSAVGIVLTFAAMYAVKSYRGRYRFVFPAFALVLLVMALVFYLNAGPAMALVGRSSDLTGRAELWRWTLAMIHQRPLLGYGFSGFWRGASDMSRTLEARIRWSPIYAHNGYLEVLLSLGFVGLALFGWMAAVGLWRSLHIARRAHSDRELWPLANMIFFLIHNIAEVSIMWQNSLEWGLFVATVVGGDPRIRVCLERESEEESVPDALPEFASPEVVA